MLDLKHILVPHDFSEASNQALADAEVLAKNSGGLLHLLHVIVDPRNEAWSVEAAGMDLESLLSQWQTDAQQRLDDLPVQGAYEFATKVGQPHKEIVEYANARDIDLIVMGTHGRGAIEHVLLGSVAEKVVRLAPCPVMTVRGAAR